MDIIEVYKIFIGHEGIEWIKPPRLRSELELEGPTKGVRGNSLRIQRASFKLRNKNSFSHAVTFRHNFFLNRVASIWNELPEHVISFPSLNLLKSSLDQMHKIFCCFSLKSDCKFNENSSNTAKLN